MNTPLWLPEGSVRAVLALMIVMAFIFGYVEAEVALVVIGAYFAQKILNGKPTR